MKKKRAFLLNTLLLTLVSFAMQTVHVTYNVYLTNKIGTAGIGLFQLTLTVYAMALTFACAGVKLGTTRLNIDRLSCRPTHSLRRPLFLCLRYALCLSVTVAVLLFVLAPWIANSWLHDERTALSLRYLSLGLPFVSVTIALQGYFTAVRQVYKTALSQGVEQMVKITCVVFFLGFLLPRGIEYACLAIVLGMLAGQVAALLLALILLFRVRLLRKKNETGEPVRLSELLHIAGPEAIGTCARSVLLSTEHLLIPRGFEASGRSKAAAMEVYGVIHGMALPVLLYPSAVLSALASLLVPEISELRVQNQTQKIQQAVHRILRLSLLYGLFVGGVFYAFARPISLCIYGNDDAVQYLQILAPLVPIMYLDMSVDGCLKGLDEQKASMRYNIIDSGLCVVLVALLLPHFAIKGYIIVLYISELYNFFFSIRRLLKVAKPPRISFRGVLQPLVCAGCAVFVPLGFLKMLLPGALEGSVLGLLAMLSGAALIYFTSLALIGDLPRVKNILAFIRGV